MLAHQVLEGEISPNLACAEIGEMNQSLDWPEELSAFGLLAHEQTGHEHIGMTSESVQPEIVHEAQKLLQRELTWKRS